MSGSPNREFRFAVIGCGVIGKTHQEQIAAIPNARMVAVADIVPVRAQELAATAGADWYADYREMLKRDDVDIVNITTPSGLHAEMTIDVAHARKHAIVEKPIEITVPRAEAMIRACRDAGVKLEVISQHRFDASTQRVKAAMDAGQFGRLVLGECAVNWYRSQAYYDSAGWRGTWTVDGGGALMNQSIHTIDLLQYLMGPVDTVFGYTSTLAHEQIEVEDVAVAAVTFANGAMGTIVGTTDAYPGLSARLEIFGTHGTAVIENDRLIQFYLRAAGEMGAAYGGTAPNLAEEAPSAEGTGAANPAAIFGNSHRLQFIDMMNAIQEDREPLVNGEEGLKPLRIILGIYESARTRREVQIGKLGGAPISVTS